MNVNAQNTDSSINVKIEKFGKLDTSKDPYTAVLVGNIFLNFKGTPQTLGNSFKKNKFSDSFFYIFASLFLLLGLLRTIFTRYFTTMFRVFFNTSLRQNQLTDQLEQAALPSLLFNIFFTLSLGLYIYILYEYNNSYNKLINWVNLFFCVLAVAICYMVKYVSILFTGWLTSHKSEAKIYIFSIFLLNKIVGMLLLPFTLIIAFSTIKVAQFAVVTSLIFLSVLLFTRFLKTYGLLQNRLKLNGIHFLIYIVALEILPILVIYRTVVVFFANNL